MWEAKKERLALKSFTVHGSLRRRLCLADPVAAGAAMERFFETGVFTRSAETP